MPRKSRVDLVGKRFGSIVIAGLTEPLAAANGSRRRKLEALCDCGIKFLTDVSSVENGGTRSCGCARIKHGHAAGGGASRTYNSWAMMHDRCRNPNDERFEHYGGRGISVCERWSSFENFLADMGERPHGCSIDRIDVNGGYNPGNCRWATVQEQVRNRRASIMVRVGGETLCLKEACDKYGQSYYKARRRVNLWGWSPFNAVAGEQIAYG